MDHVVTVDAGRLRGTSSSDGTVRSFLGVPYAAPPVGDLRWRPPQPVQGWSGIRDATAYGPASRQPAIPANSLYYGHETRFSEDCLYLNVWTGSVSGTAGRPVMVWLHPGAYQFGSGQNPLYDGSALARDGITLVTINHRLGRFGFLSHPLLSEESGYGGSGNYGLMDILEALRWIQRNIEQFGGSPDNVTLFGESGGASKIAALLAMPAAKGLFPLGAPVETDPWMGSRPCFADSRPVIGRAAKHPGLWLAFGHGHWGLTLGPMTGRLIAELVTGRTPFCDPAPYAAERFV